MPGRSMYSRTICPPITCSATTCAIRLVSTRLYRAVAPRGPGSVANPLPRVGAASPLRISLTRTLGPLCTSPETTLPLQLGVLRRTVRFQHSPAHVVQGGRPVAVPTLGTAADHDLETAGHRPMSVTGARRHVNSIDSTSR